MKVFNVLVAASVLVMSCKEAPKSEENKESAVEEKVVEATYESFGADFEQKNPLASADMLGKYISIRENDSLDLQFEAKVLKVCPKKGCWMQLELNDGTEAMVRFKDYGFFVPKDIAGSTVVVNGKAFVSEQSVGELKHYAEDAGKSAEEIAAITEPKKTFGFLADGVHLERAGE